MCLNCGCGEPNERHHPTDITRDDLQRAADGGEMSLEEAARNVATSSEQLAGGQPAEASSSASAKQA
ncbi:MAG: hypothetical protein ABJC39_03280 [Chloroflexota bacterium]